MTTIADDDFLYRALGRMSRLNIQHLGVVNRSGEVVGTISAADLLRHRVTSALALGDEIDAAQTVPQLGRAWAGLPQVVATSLREGVEPTDVAAIIGAEIRTLTARAAGLAVNRMIVSGKGVPPCRYAVLVLRPTSTVTRLTELKVRSLVGADMIDRAISAFTVMVRTILAQQVSDSHRGIKLSARVDVAAMGPEEKESLTKAMRAINELIGATLQL